MANAQENRVVVQLLNGKSGKPVAHAKLLAFVGTSADHVKEKIDHINALTDDKGFARLVLPAPDMRWVQVFPNDKILCQQVPNQQAFGVKEIISQGLVAPNTCNSKLNVHTKPGYFVVFARPASILEGMRR